jgi:TolB protein
MLILLPLVLTFQPESRSATATPIGGGGQIAFTTNRNGYDEIYIMEADGSNHRRITNSQANNYLGPGAWSPDGKRIVFSSERDNRWGEIYTMDVDGTNIHRLTNNRTPDWSPAWSPDGNSIAFTGGSKNAQQIHVMDADGKNVRQLTTNGNNVLPSWSPNGKFIVFTSTRNGRHQIFRIEASGANEIALMSRDCNCGSPVWSRDGKYIVFDANTEGNREIFIIDADGSNQRLVSDLGKIWAMFNPAFSPDSRQIAYQSVSEDGGYEIFVMNVDGSNPRNLTRNKADDYTPAWSP